MTGPNDARHADTWLHAGPLRALFEPATGFLRYIETGGCEAVRAVYGAVRDRNWDTLVPRIDVDRIEQHAEGFEVRFTAASREADRDVFRWRGAFSGSAADRSITCEFDGEALAEFRRNRIGWCILHPAVCAGLPCRVEHVDGAVTEAAFPEFISPHQPFQGMREISHRTASGAEVRVRMDGEVFEMEDQRNWTDASFKTYSTPLDVPFPVALKAGDRVRQTVTITAVKSHAAPDPAAHDDKRITINAAWNRGAPRAQVGFCMPAADIGALTENGTARLRSLCPDHLRVDVRPAREDASLDRLRDAALIAQDAGASLHIAAHLDEKNESAQLRRLAGAAREISVPVSLWLVFRQGSKATPRESVECARDVLGAAAAIAAGASAYFTELNRNRPNYDTAGILTCYSINPQVHAFDDRSLIESLGAQAVTVASAREIADGGVVISPVTLRPRFNPNATDPDEARRLDLRADPRQRTMFGAQWCLGSLGHLLPEPELRSLTYFESHGPRGVMTADGKCFPAAHIFQALDGFPLAVAAETSDPLGVVALALSNPDGRRRLLAANFRPKSFTAKFDLGAAEHPAEIRKLGSYGWESAASPSAAGGSGEVEIPAGGIILIDAASRAT